VQLNRTVYSMTDGIPRTEADALAPSRRAELDRVQIAGYHGGFKEIVDQGGTEYRFRFDDGATTLLAADSTGFDPGPFGGIPGRLRSVLALPEPTSVSQRIAGWGY
jgi:hypothetical protein